MDIETLKETLSAKLEQEFSQYKQDLIANHTAEEIFEKSYETTFKEETKDILVYSNLDEEKAKMLLKTDNLLSRMYVAYMEQDQSMLDSLRDTLEDITGQIKVQNEKNIKYKNNRESR